MFAVPLQPLVLFAFGVWNQLVSDFSWGQFHWGGGQQCHCIDRLHAAASRKGTVIDRSGHQCGQRRLRPVLITTLTTSGGMLPLALTTGEGEQLWGPMGKTALGGLLVSSAVTLVLVPTMYVIVVRFQQRFSNSSSDQAISDLPNQEDVAK